MKLLTNKNSLLLWQDVVKEAECRCSIELKGDIESYLVNLLDRYTNQPDVVKQVLATAFLEAQQQSHQSRKNSLQIVGDQCLLFAGLFPQVAGRRLVKISYFVDMGRHAYISVSDCTNDLFSHLAIQFVIMMDVLQSIREYPALLPLEAYEQWRDVGSERALAILKTYTKTDLI